MAHEPFHGNHSGSTIRDPKKRGPRTGGVRPMPRAVRVDVANEFEPQARAYGAQTADTDRPFAARPGMPEESRDDGNQLVGRNAIREALKAGQPLEKLLVARGDLSSSARQLIAMARDAGVVIQEVDRVRLDRIYPNHQGLIAYASCAEYATLDDLFDCAAAKGEPPLFVLLDGITDPHNMGAIIRSAECFGAHGVVVPERRSAGLNPACVKAAAGALAHIKVARVHNLHRAIAEIKARGVWVCAADMDGESLHRADLSGPLAIVIGAEGEGISQLTRKICDRTVSIPLCGQIGSLNASVAAGILLYAVAQSRA